MDTTTQQLEQLGSALLAQVKRMFERCGVTGEVTIHWAEGLQFNCGPEQITLYSFGWRISKPTSNKDFKKNFSLLLKNKLVSK